MGLYNHLEDTNNADDICLLVHNYMDISNKLNIVLQAVTRAETKINVGKGNK